MRFIKRHYLMGGAAAVLAAALALSAVGRQDQPSSATQPNQPSPVTRPDQPTTMTMPEHTVIHVTLDQAVSSNRNKPGDHFSATVSQPVVVDGTTVIPKGAHVRGLVVDARHSGRLKGRARLQLALQSVNVDGQSYRIHTVSDRLVGRDHKKRNLALMGGGGAGGAVIGALAAGGTGALIGGPIGLGAGTTAALLTGKHDIKLPPETRMKFELAQPATIGVKG